ncbi:MAG: hypothetical protein AABW90_02640 [Nanoarchaeota archaeon]
MKKRLICLLFVILVTMLVMPLFLALDISIKTLPNHKISIIIRAAEQLSSLDSYHQETGDGNVFISSEVSEDPVDLLVTLKKDDINILNKKFEGVSTAKLININFVPGEEIGIVAKEEKNETPAKITESNASVQTSNDTERTTNQTSETNESVEGVEKPGVTSKAIENIKNIATSKTTYYIIAGIVAIAILFFAVRFARDRFSPENFRVTKLSSISSHDKRLEDAERKLDSAKKELDEIKDRKKRLQEAKERFRRDQKELEGLEKHY